MNKVISTTAISLLAIGISAAAFSKMEMKMHKGMQMQMKYKYCQEYIDLTPAKREQLDKITSDCQNRQAVLKQKLYAKTTMLKAQLAQLKINKKAVRQLVKDINNLRNELFAGRIETKMQVIEILGVMPAICRPAKIIPALPLRMPEPAQQRMMPSVPGLHMPMMQHQMELRRQMMGDQKGR